ncbi:MAG: cell division protein FtsL [Pseudomonadales bacterium]|jgi:cell division protein FtsL|nr:cell division protein FtsL [Pseudomonadales bacterium]MDP7144971.1 cell division protein FtsL [Pseudomonadales bacterium]MDP7357153.1 cell division protein FtsL [Pseudomonadales bacterium]MDP7594784.1 cell division protein FtsL [Pseudomonadales bacterium]HJN50037.1 cell division protein FtsL [Pseudomonadales bacterium]|tara:strand:+ start:2244 stop:2570 length:327 start_codon:yes stop_codon:yes gene_type:complete
MLKGSILVELFRWMLQRSIVLTLVALVLTVGSALSVIYVTHLNRQLYSQLQDLQKHKDVLASEYEKLLLEQSAWSEYSRVENLSESRLAMKTPAAGDVILVEYAKDSR